MKAAGLDVGPDSESFPSAWQGGGVGSGRSDAPDRIGNRGRRDKRWFWPDLQFNEGLSMHMQGGGRWGSGISVLESGGCHGV